MGSFVSGFRKVKAAVLLLACAAGLVTPVATAVPAGAATVHRTTVHRGAVHRPPVHRPPVHRPPVHRPPVHRPPVVVRPPVARPGVVVVNPPFRYWSPGGAIAAGAALGFIAGAAAVSWAGQPPQAGMCWYYTTPARTSGFWDRCP